jgi:hypothetical protein
MAEFTHPAGSAGYRPPVLGHTQYGKAETRVVRVFRDPGTGTEPHEIVTTTSASRWRATERQGAGRRARLGCTRIGSPGIFGYSGG